MKVLLVNGSSHLKDGTWQALGLVEEALHENGIETEWFWIGNKPVRGCIDCQKCAKTLPFCTYNILCNSHTTI